MVALLALHFCPVEPAPAPLPEKVAPFAMIRAPHCAAAKTVHVVGLML